MQANPVQCSRYAVFGNLLCRNVHSSPIVCFSTGAYPLCAFAPAPIAGRLPVELHGVKQETRFCRKTDRAESTVCVATCGQANQDREDAETIRPK